MKAEGFRIFVFYLELRIFLTSVYFYCIFTASFLILSSQHFHSQNSPLNASLFPLDRTLHIFKLEQLQYQVIAFPYPPVACDG